MSHLIHIKQKIKTVETISKVTHAMRLIAMSSHAQLKQDLSNVTEYANNLCRLFEQARNDNPSWSHPLLKKQNNDSKLLVIVGSQKGLCGSFTNIIAHKAIAAYTSTGHQTIITVGKQINTFLSTNHGTVPAVSFNQFNSDNYATIAQAIVDYIWNNEVKFDQISIISMKSKGFFMQVPMTHELIEEIFFTKNSHQKLEYYYEKNIQSTLDSLFKQTLVAILIHYLHDSLIAEQAARFLSMDNSTRNAKNILEATKLYYYKLRQTKITTQLLELITVSELH
jgi:F-type H+-transporting ATPase subunit gamma